MRFRSSSVVVKVSGEDDVVSSEDVRLKAGDMGVGAGESTDMEGTGKV